MVARTILLVLLAVGSVSYLASHTTYERECLTYHTDLGYSTEAGRYVVIDRPCVLWGNLYAR